MYPSCPHRPAVSDQFGPCPFGCHDFDTPLAFTSSSTSGKILLPLPPQQPDAVKDKSDDVVAICFSDNYGDDEGYATCSGCGVNPTETLIVFVKTDITLGLCAHCGSLMSTKLIFLMDGAETILTSQEKVELATALAAKNLLR